MNNGNELMKFSNEQFGSVRAIEIDGQPWFIGKDVAMALGYGEGKSLANAVANHVDAEDKGVTELMTPGGLQKMVIINESGLYSLILSSKLPKAKEFKRWITHDVIPSLRKNGGYIVGQESMSREELLARALKVADSVIEEKEQRIKELEPKGEYFDRIVDTKLNTNFRDTAKELGMNQKEFIQWLIDNKYIYRDAAGNIRPYAKYANTGKNYFELKEWSNGSISGIRTLITPAGKQEFMNKLNKEVFV